MALLGPLLATLADRHERRLVMIGSDLSRAAVIVVGAVLIAADGPPVAIYAAGLLTGGAVAGVPARRRRPCSPSWRRTRES